jgi:hypothetical protein
MKRMLFFIASLAASLACAQDDAPPQGQEVLISLADQKLVLLREGGWVGKYRISTSKFGAGDSFGSYKTPLGHLKICEKIGDSLTVGSVIKNRSATGEILPVNAPGRDPIVTRILWLEGLEDQNRNARIRGIYIHGTPEERTIGQAKSWGCIRMRSSDVVELFDQVGVGTPVTIVADHLPRLQKYRPPQPVLIAANTHIPPPVAKETTAPAPKEQPTPSPEPVLIIPSGISPVLTLSRADSESKHEAAPGSEKEKAWHAMKGSILLAGLPGAPKFGASQSAAAEAKTEAKP